MMKRTLHKVLSMLLTATMVVNMGLTPVFAEGVPLSASGLTDCHTEHDDTCGYTETITPCTHTCEACESLDSCKPQEKICTCPPADSGELVHGEDCPLYTAPKLSEAVQALIALVDALPNAVDITEENKEATSPAYEGLALAYEALSDADKAAFGATEQYEKLMALQAVLFGTGLTPAEMDLLQRGEQNQAALSLDEQLAYLQLVEQLHGESRIMRMALDDTETPFQIGTAVQLADLAAKVNEGNENFNAKSYILENNIDLSAYQSSTDWTPIGNSSKQFKGTFDGNGKIITGPVIDDNNADYRGLFGVIGADGIVKNLGVVDCIVTGFYYIGGVAGINHGMIQDCYTTGSISGGNAVGGVAGQNFGSIQNCYATSNVSGTGYVGGVAGYNDNGQITNCYATGNVSGIGYVVGGVMGCNDKGQITNCAALNSSVSGTKNVGRVVGLNNSGTLTSNYAWSGMTGGGSNTTATGTDGADLTCTDGTLDTQFSDIFGGNVAWTFADNKLPLLKNAGDSQSSDLPLWMTTAANADTIFISTAEQLAQLAAEVNGGDNKDGKTYILANNIDLSAYQSDTGWTPIGSDVNWFNGSFDGCGKVITGLVIDNANASRQGLFGVIDLDGRVKNLGVVDCNIKGSGNVGGVAGVNIGRIENCYSTGSVSGSLYVGGVVGVNIGRIENCVALNPSVSGSSVGRVVGKNDKGTLTNNYAWSGMPGGGDNTADGTDGADLNCTGGALGKQFSDIFGGNAAWEFADNKLPILKNVGGSQSSALPLWMTTAVDADTFIISTAEQLAQLATEVNGGDVKTGKTYILANNISLSAYQSGTGWTPIGNYDKQFKGSFDGNDKIITELFINNPTAHYQGLFGRIGTDGTVKNLGVVDCDITGHISVGGVAGNNNGGIENCYSTGSISGKFNVGGVAGYNASGKLIENCYSTGSISGTDHVGGVAGNNNGGIENCYSTGSVSGTVSVGGVAGYNNDTVENCAALNSSVSGANNVGRVVGRNDSTLTSNYAWSGMSVKQGGNDKPLDKGVAKTDGEDVFAVGGILKKNDNTAFSWETDLGFVDTVWDIPTGAYKLPRLLGSSASYPAMPSGGLVEQVTINQGKTEFMYAPGGVDIASAFNVLATDAVKVKYTTPTAGAAISDSTLTFATAPTGNTTVEVIATVAAGTFNSAASLTVSITVKPQPATTTTLAADKAAITYGDSVTLTATVAKANSDDPGEPSGSVQFKNGGASLGAPVAVVGGQAKYTLTDLPVGAHSITAVFTSDSSSLFDGSTSPAVTVTVSSNGGGGGSTGGGSSSGGGNNTPSTGNNQNTNEDAKVPAKVDNNGNATATVNEQHIANAIKKAQNTTDKNGIAVNIMLESDKAINSFTVILSKAIQKQLVETNVRTVTISSGNLSITFDMAALNHIYTTANADVTVTVTKTVNSALSAEAQAAIGNRPVYDFKVTGGGKNITTFGNGKISIGIPYELQRVDANGKKSDSGSFENPGNLVGVYVDTNGKLIYLPGSSYNTTSKTMRLSTDHLSFYGVAYQTNAPTFTDTANHWAKDDIDFVVARGLLTGTGGNQFSPDGEMTRGMFVTVLGRLANADVSGYKTGSFSDVATESYYLGYVEWAVKNKIASGVSEGKFAPDRAISREEMAVMLQSYTRAMGYQLPNAHPAIVFTDNTTIAPWAQTAVKEMQMAGILYGRDGGKFAPNGTATRGEASAMLRRFVELVINGATV